MGRRDYEDDPNAPAANSLVPAASAVVVDDSGRILLHRRRDNDQWALPGGAMHLGESLPDCAVRETHEETGYDIELIGIVGTCSNPRHVFAYDNGEVRQEFSICFLARPVAGTLRYPRNPPKYAGSNRQRWTRSRWSPASANESTTGAAAPCRLCGRGEHCENLTTLHLCLRPAAMRVPSTWCPGLPPPDSPSSWSTCASSWSTGRASPVRPRW